jgi:endonuclease/exonuclease/phosphatase family metal-dependent hydrolase
MTFNTTCAHLCEKGKFDKFKERKHWILDTIKRTNPDLISLQEVLSTKQLRWFKKRLPEYHMRYYRKYFIFRYADPAILVKKSKFDITKSGGFWLGPRKGKFSFGWKTAFPRQIRWTKIIQKDSGQEFYFAGSHFDNSKKNKENSAKVMVKAFENLSAPVIFAADTNLRPHMDGFKHLNQSYYDSYDITKNVSYLKNSETNPDDSCNLEKGKTFPSCRVDHIFLDKKYDWEVSNWIIDQYKYGKNNRFTSDHRALIADIELK